jgi:hypothetical protein
MKALLLSCLSALALMACGHHSGGTTDANGTGDPDADPNYLPPPGDAPFAGTCTPGAAQCSNCIDDDGDMKIDGFDPECTGPLDNLENSFKTGIPGDNIDSTSQDCFFDGNSGAGNDGCNQHTCCLLQSPDKATCHQQAPLANENKYDIAKCYEPFGQVPVPQQCIDVCAPLAPPGCDCFGCCTICSGSTCADVDINPLVSPNCTAATIGDPTVCKRCVKSTSCGGSTCGGATCVLCPGQDPSTLDPSCMGTNSCPMGFEQCSAIDQSCPAGTYCSNGCCIGTIQ